MDNKNQDLNEMLQIRREKLENLKADGKNPHAIVNFRNRSLSKDIKDNFEELWQDVAMEI